MVFGGRDWQGIRKETEEKLTLELESGRWIGWLGVGERRGALLGEDILRNEWKSGAFWGTACSWY